jgi:hypothetical protein
VIDSSWTAVRGLISNNNAPSAPAGQDEEAATTGVRPGMRPRQASTFSLASVTASVANIAAAAAASTSAARNRSRASSRASEQVQAWGANQELMEVSSRPESIREVSDYPSSADEDEEEEDDVAGAGRGAAHQRTRSDARSIRSVSSMMSKEGRKEERDKERISLSDRLANIGVLGRLGGEAAQNTNEPTPAPAPVPAATSKVCQPVCLTRRVGGAYH